MRYPKDKTKVLPLREKGGRKVKARESRAAQVANLKADLAAKFGDAEYLDLDMWEAALPQDLRDYYAVKALLLHGGRPEMALVTLGFNRLGTSGMALKQLINRVFFGETTRALIEKKAADIDANWDDIIARQVQIAKYGEDDAAVRAAIFIAKLSGRQQTPDAIIDKRTVNLYNLFAAPDAQRLPGRKAADEPSATTTFLDHEPGPPTRITVDDDRVIEAIGTGLDE
jgi:hypothetical protein